MPKPMHIQFPGLDPIRILFEDRTALAIDKPAGWMLIPFTWQRTNRNLQAAIESSMAADHFWARSRNLKYLRHVHRLDAETTGVLLFAKSQGALDAFAELFEQRRMEKVYLAVASGEPRRQRWICQKAIGPVPKKPGRMQIDAKAGKPAETAFQELASANGRSLIECRPVTGRTHQIRVHLLDAGLSIVGDPLYGNAKSTSGDQRFPMGLRAVELGFTSPFTRKRIRIQAPCDAFLAAFEFQPLHID